MKKLIFIVLLICFSINAYAADKEVVNKVPAVLDVDAREAWTTANEFYVYYSTFYGDSLGNSWLTGGDYMFHFAKRFGVGASFNYSQTNHDENTNYATYFTNKHVYIYDVTGMLSMPCAFRMRSIPAEADLFLLLGVGTININSSYEPHGFIGGGMKIFVGWPWLAIRIDLRTSMHSTPKTGGDKEFDQDLLLMVGLSFNVPPRI